MLNNFSQIYLLKIMPDLSLQNYESIEKIVKPLIKQMMRFEITHQSSWASRANLEKVIISSWIYMDRRDAN